MTLSGQANDHTYDKINNSNGGFENKKASIAKYVAFSSDCILEMDGSMNAVANHRRTLLRRGRSAAAQSCAEPAVPHGSSVLPCPDQFVRSMKNNSIQCLF
jgi:hypothetical protein